MRPLASALYDDDCLLAVRRSHRRVRTAEERHATTSQNGSIPMPGAETLHLNAGQAIFYDAQILHRGSAIRYTSNFAFSGVADHSAPTRTYNSKVKRATLHGLHQDMREPPSRGGGVLQHGTEWLASQEFRDTLKGNQRSLGMLNRALDWSAKARELGYKFAQEDI